MKFNENFIKEALSHVSILYGEFPSDPQFCVDSRIIKSGDIFVALEGAHCDGHDFVSQAFDNGAAGVMIATEKKDSLKKIDQKILKKKLVITVPNVLESLLKLASTWRKSFNYPVVGITGSVGKTSTKEIIANILSVNGSNYIASYDNQNTKIGAAINILRMREHHEVAIFELGISKRGEMAELAELVRPTTAVIAGIGHQHMDGLGSLQDIALEKREIFKCFTEKNIGIVNGDQPILGNVSYPHPVLKFGSKTTNQIQARKVRIAGSHISFVLKIYGKKYSIALRNPHFGAVFNSLAATAVTHLLQVPVEVIIKAIQMPLVIAGRFEERAIKSSNGTLINDCYNANPESMKAALLAFQQIETKAPKVAVLGDMLGLGVNSPFWHRQLGRFLRKVPSLTHVVLVGDSVEWTKKTAPVGLAVDHVNSWQEAQEKLTTILGNESMLLVKGSHGTGLVNLVNNLSTEIKIN